MPRIHRTDFTATTFGYRKRTTIGFWNVRTLWDECGNARLMELERELILYNIDMLGLSEVRWRGAGEFITPNSQYVLLYSGQEDETPRRAGVGILLTKALRKSLLSWTPVSDRIIVARLKTRVRNITIIQCYAPTEQADLTSKEAFYQQLGDTFDKAPKGDIKIVMGDLNAKVGTFNIGLEHVMGRFGLGSRNANGELFIEFCNSRQLVIGGTLFKHKNCHLTSWVSPDGRTENQIDHFAISKPWRKCLLDVRAKRGADIGSDHHLMIARVRLCTAAVNRPRNETSVLPQFDVQKLRNPTVQRAFSTMLRTKASALNTTGDVPIDHHWDSAKECFLDCGNQIVGKRESGRRPWISDATWSKIQERKQIKVRINSASDDAQKKHLRAEYRSLQKGVQKSVRRDKRNYTNALADKAEAAAYQGDSGTLYKITKQLVGKTLATQHPVRSKDGSLLSTQEDQLRRWREHFAEVLNNTFGPASSSSSEPSYFPHMSGIDTSPPTKLEVLDAINDMDNGKAPGIDGIPAEFYKTDRNAAADILLPLIRECWELETLPTEWKKGVIVKIPKKGDLKDCNNWRGICLLPAVSKIMAKIVLYRIKQSIDRTLGNQQAGFREGFSCSDHINTLRIIIEQSVEWRSPLHLMFVDYEKAFDSVNRDYIWDALRRRGIPDKIIAIVKESYQGANCHVLHNGKLSEPFEVLSGVRQGCILSPLLFLVVINDVLSSALDGLPNRGIRWKLYDHLSHLDYADDVCLLSTKTSHISQMLEALTVEGRKAGLKINAAKTKYMGLDSSEGSGICLAGQQIEAVDKFCYLGSVVTADGGAEADVQARINKARAAFGILAPIWRTSNISTSTKLRIFETNVKSVLLYGCSTWKVTHHITSKLQTFVNQCLRRILRIHWPETISNQDLLDRTGQDRIDTYIRRRKWQWIGHTLRKDPNNIAQQALTWNPQGSSTSRRVGRPRTTWKRSVEKERTSLCKTWGELKTVARNRIRWRKDIVGALCPTRG